MNSIGMIDGISRGEDISAVRIWFPFDSVAAHDAFNYIGILR